MKVYQLMLLGLSIGFNIGFIIGLVWLRFKLKKMKERGELKISKRAA